MFDSISQALESSEVDIVHTDGHTSAISCSNRSVWSGSPSKLECAHGAEEILRFLLNKSHDE